MATTKLVLRSLDPSKHVLLAEPDERDDERLARLERERKNADSERLKDFGTFLAALLAFVTIFVVCLVVAVSSSASAEDKKWAMSVLSATVAGVLGYLLGKGRSSA